MFDHQNCHAPFFGKATDNNCQFLALGGTESSRWFVEHENAWMHGHGPCDCQETPLAVGQILDVAVEVMVELELNDGTHDLGRKRRVNRPNQVTEVGTKVLWISRHAQVLEDCGVFEEFKRLE